MAQLTDITLAGIAPATVLFKASHVDRNQVGYMVHRPSTSEVSATPLTIQNQIVQNGQTKVRNIKGRVKLQQPRVGNDPVLGELALDVAYAEAVFTFPLTWTTAQKEHFVKLFYSALGNATVVSTAIGNEKPF